ncbi:MAG: pyridoxamine 5'-phosphate oxidase [Wenzhouxiangellaceae bacterium]|nr:pyridoxamine 5'-phosphate oxidase [Wenzhouxiangellaceae bacterium]
MIAMTDEMLRRFRAGFEAAVEAGVPEPTAMTLATVGADGRPSARTVLLKDFDADGFVFYTNLGSRKARQVAENPEVSLLFWWRETGQQVLVDGRAERVDDAEADAYFASRPRDSQLGAWASRQSEPLADRATLMQRVDAARQRFGDGDVPRPPHWSGFRVRPRRVEFWHAGEYRLHDRFCFVAGDGDWTMERLYP